MSKYTLDDERDNYASGIRALCKPCPFCGAVPRVNAWSEFTREIDANDDVVEAFCYLISCCIAETRCLETWNSRRTAHKL